MSIITQSTGLDTVFGQNFDARLERIDANTIQLVGVEGSSKRCWVRDRAIPIYDPLTIDTDSASEYIITGSGTVAKGGALSSLTDNDYNNYGLHYVYLCNDADCWNFTDYDRRRQLIISATPPIEEGGYLHDWGDGANARHVGWIALDSSRQFEGDHMLFSVFNDTVKVVHFSGDGGSTTATTSWVWADNTVDGGGVPRNRNILIPRNRRFIITVHGPIRNDSNKWAGYRLYSDTYAVTARCKVNASSHGHQTPYGKDAFVSSLDRVENFKTQVGCYSGGNAYADDVAEPTCEITFYPTLQNNGFTRQFTQEYEAIARTTNGGRMERVSDTTLEWQPHLHGSIGLYNGLNWEVVTPVNNPSASNTATTISGGALAVDTNYDVYLTYASAASATLEFQEWAGATSRYQDPVRFEGVYVYEDNEAGRKKRWLGIVRMDDDSGAKFKDERQKRFVCNSYNTTPKTVSTYNTNSTWNTAGANQVFREYNAGSGQVRGYFLICKPIDKLGTMSVYIRAMNGRLYQFLGIDGSTDRPNTDGGEVLEDSYSSGYHTSFCHRTVQISELGLHYITQMEADGGSSVENSSYNFSSGRLEVDV